MKEVKAMKEESGRISLSGQEQNNLYENLDTFTGIMRDLSHRAGSELIGKKKYLRHIINTVDKIHEML